MNKDETLILQEIMAKSSDTDKIKYIVYMNNNGINSSKIECLLVDPVYCVDPVDHEKNVSQQGKQGTPGKQVNSLKKDKKVMTLLKRLIDRNCLERDESVKPYVYKLSKQTKLDIDNEVSNTIKKNKELALEQKSIEEDKNYMNSSLSFWKDYAAKHSFEGKKEYIIDLRKLFKEASFVTFDILKHLFDNPDEQLELAKIAYNQLFNIRPEIIIKGFLESKQRLKDLRNEKSLISIECQVDFKTDILKFLETIKYECPSCGNIATINNSSCFLREKIKPLNNCACGRKGGFRELSFETLSYQKLLISDLDINLLPGEQSVTKNAIIKNSLVNPVHERILNVGDKIHITGLLKDYKENDNDSEIKTYFEVLGFEFIDKTNLDNKISDEEKEVFFNLANSGEVIERLSYSLFCKHKGDDLAKQLCTLQMFSGFKSEDRESLHLLLFGDPGTGKSSNFLEKINSFYHRKSKIAQNNNTAAGLGVASMKNDFLGKNIVELGAVPRANKGFLLIDELNDINQEVHGNCIEAMESCTVTSNKAGAKGTFPADIKVLATMNPVTEFNTFLSDVGLFSQPMGMSGKFVDRFDFVIPFVEKDKSLVSKIRSKKAMVNIKPEFDEFFIKKYLLFSENITPFFRENLEDQFEEVFGLFGERDVTLSRQSGYRIIRKCRNLVKAIARIHLSSTVESLHIQLAGDIYNDYLDLMENFNANPIIDSSEEFVVDGRDSVKKSMGSVAEFRSGELREL